MYLRWSNIGKYFLVELLMIEAWCSAIFGKIFVVHPVIKRIRGRNSPSWLEDGENGKRECRADDKSNEFLASAPRIESVSITCVWWNLITWNYIEATRSRSSEIWGSFAFTDYSHSFHVPRARHVLLIAIAEFQIGNWLSIFIIENNYY